jgi:LysR family carnitine catabolism transcriptional activator
MDSNRLRHFVAVVDHGGFTAAARAVYVSQPALSLAVKELETELGVALFTRTGRRVQLTPAGAALLESARQVLRDLETGQAAVEAVAGLQAGSLTMASLPTLAADPVAPLVGAFRRLYPGVRIELAAPEGTSELFDLVVAGTCELGVTDARDIPDALESHPLGRQSLVLILPPGSDHVEGAEIDLVSLAGTPFVVAPPGTSTFRLLEEGFAAVHGAPAVAVVTAQRDGRCARTRVGGAYGVGAGCDHGPAVAASRAGPGPHPPGRPDLACRHPLHRARDGGVTTAPSLAFNLHGLVNVGRARGWRCQVRQRLVQPPGRRWRPAVIGESRWPAPCGEAHRQVLVNDDHWTGVQRSVVGISVRVRAATEQRVGGTYRM